MFQNDYIMREIENLTRFLGKVFFHKDSFKLEFLDEDMNVSGEGLLYLKLKRMVASGKINEAENLLFEEIELDPSEKLFAVALRFYDDLRQMTDESLSACGFSQEEILEGLEEIRSMIEFREPQE